MRAVERSIVLVAEPVVIRLDLQPTNRAWDYVRLQSLSYDRLHGGTVGTPSATRVFLKTYRWRRPVPSRSPVARPLSASRVSFISTADSPSRSPAVRRGIRGVTGRIVNRADALWRRWWSPSQRGVRHQGYAPTRISPCRSTASASSSQRPIGSLNHRHFCSWVDHAPGASAQQCAGGSQTRCWPTGSSRRSRTDMTDVQSDRGSIAAEVERRGIATVCLTLLRDVAEEVRPRERWPCVCARISAGRPDDPALQTKVLRRPCRSSRLPASRHHRDYDMNYDRTTTGRDGRVNVQN